MNPDYTQQQSLDGLQQSEKLSLQATVPPAEVPGYRIEKLLGQGAFGQVWLALDLNTGRKVAIKFYSHRGGVDWSLLRREVNHLVNMSTGRYIVQVLNVGWDAEPAYYVMEFLENGSLEDLIRARGAMSVNDTVKMFREIADGLSFAHSKGVLHCDLKPANVVLDHDWRPRLADFGQSRMSTDQTPSLGTLFYMAPEQADLDAAPDAAWDVYALGAIAYTMLVGSPPYRTPNIVETLDTAASLPERLQRYRETIQAAPKPRLHYRRRRIDKSLCQIVDRCLAVRPEKRYQNVQQVIGAIDAWNRARTRRPLYLLGILGPILLLILMMVTLARSISVANEIAMEAVKSTALQSNQYASTFAARTLENEIESLFQLVKAEAQRQEFRDLISTTIRETQEILEELSDGTAAVAQREPFIENAVRKKLDEYLASRLIAMANQPGAANSTAIINSLIVNETRGINIGATFSRPDEQSATPVGGNFSYRSYFNGNTSDGSKSVPRSQFSPTRAPVLSASFRSTTTGNWKIGVSAPIWPDNAIDQSDSPPPPDVQPLAVLILTINLGDFQPLQDDTGGMLDRFAVLVDGRVGPQLGTLLHHPLLHDLDPEEALKLKVPQINQRLLEQLQYAGGTFDYYDPAAELSDEGLLDGRWIAAMSQVRLPREQKDVQEGRAMSDLWVLVQGRSSKVEEPISRLSARLRMNSYWALASVVAVVALLWYFVLRLKIFSNESESAGSGSGSRSTSYASTVDQSH